jgi:uncharacterized surface protein with fasciclin (FAS1) repeats
VQRELRRRVAPARDPDDDVHAVIAARNGSRRGAVQRGTMKTLIVTLMLSLLVVSSRASAEPKDIVDTAVAAGSFKTLTKALTEAGLVDTLKGKGPFTVFAPTDEAFAKLPKGALEALLKDKKKLIAVLTFHVVSGSVKAADVAKLSTAKTLNGQSLAIKTSGGAVTVNGAKVVTADIETSNGVIHVIDTVLLPK